MICRRRSPLTLAPIPRLLWVTGAGACWSPCCAIQSWDEYDCTIREMGVDWQQGWKDRLKHAEEMFRSVARVGAADWESEGWQHAKNPIIVPWDKDSSPARFILPLSKAWLKKETLPGALPTRSTIA